MTYEYGSRPDCNCIEFACFLAPLLPMDDKVFYWRNTLAWRGDGNMPLALFRNICHWKSRRRFADVLQNTAEQVGTAWHQVFDGLGIVKQPTDGSIQAAVKVLCILRGVEVRTASALLTAWNPQQFAVMDYKVISVLRMPERYSVRDYVSYLARLTDFRSRHDALKNCALRQIELALWHYYEIQRVEKVERPGLLTEKMANT